MWRWFKRFLWGKGYGPCPPPDLAALPDYKHIGQEVEEVFYSKDSHQRAVVTRDKTGTYRVQLEVWDTSDWEQGYNAHWHRAGNSHFTDDIKIARQLAREDVGTLHAGQEQD